MKQKLTTLLGVFVVCNQLQAQPIDNSPGGAASGFNSNQYWSRAGNNNGSGANNIFGTRWGSDIWIMTNSRYTARFTYNDALTSLTGDAGDGLRIINPLVATGGNLDLFTSANSGTNETHARFGNSGQISGQNNRMEFLSNGNQGFWFDALTTPGNYKFAQQGTVYGFLGTNHFWRIGEQGAGTNLNAERRLHVVDRDYQFRLTYAGSSSNSIFYTDFYSNDQGNLQILPSGKRVGINTGFDPQATIDVNGDARIRNVQIADPFCLLIGINADPGVPQDVNVRRLDFTANPNDVLLGNGTFGPVPGIGAACGSPNSAGALTSDSRINLNNHNFYFANYAGLVSPASNRVAVGYNCSTPLPAKFNVYQQESNSLGTNTTAGYFENRDIGLVSGLKYIGVHSIAHGIQNVEEIENIGGLFIGMDTHWNVGVRGVATPGAYNNTTGNTNTASVGGDFSAYTGLVASSGFSAYGVRTTAYGATNNYGISTNATGGSIAYGIYATASAGTTTRAGYFAGVIDVSGTVYTSDQQFKLDVSSLNSSLEAIIHLRPVKYLFDTDGFPQFNFDSNQQFGFIAQEVEQVFPNLVKQSQHPALFDSLGNEISPAVDYKSLNYIGLIPINTQAIIELNQKLEDKDSIINDLNARLTNLENCLSALLPTLCSMNQSLIQNNSNEQQEQVRKNLAVTLNDRTAIVLDQNMPNPFAEQTVVNFSVPATVLKAQIHFYDGNGKLIQSVDLTERGLGSLTVFGSDLSSGTYTYTLVADGQIVATKKMMKQ